MNNYPLHDQHRDIGQPWENVAVPPELIGAARGMMGTEHEWQDRTLYRILQRALHSTLPEHSLADLNKPEPLRELLPRLYAEANGKPCDVSVPDALEFRREAYGLTQEQWAGVLLIGQSHYSEVINGRRALPKAAIKRAYALGVPADVLLASQGTQQ
jgi:antitoxin component HigA of HigAB toxin-antitoxin module